MGEDAKKDGKRLEELVASVEKALKDQGFQIVTNRRVYVDGVQIAEFDVEVRGKVGSTDFSWLIECRDRPSSGPAPSAWIEQLYGRRERFRFNKVTAVSTTGFAAGAADFAESRGIELREVTEPSPDQLAWLTLRFLENRTRIPKLDYVKFNISKSVAPEIMIMIKEKLAGANYTTPLLGWSENTNIYTARDAFAGALDARKDLDEILGQHEEGCPVDVTVAYPEHHFFISTDAGNVRIESIRFVGHVKLASGKLGIVRTTDYRRLDAPDAILQTVTFAPIETSEFTMEIEFQRNVATGETKILGRMLGRP